MTARPSASESARLLRQRLEMGATDLVLDGMTREEALALIAAGRRQDPTGAPVASSTPGVSNREGMSGVSSPPATSGDSATSAASGVSNSPGGAARTQASAGVTGRAGDRPSGPAARTATEERRPLAEVRKPSGAPARALPVLPDDYDALRDLALGCTACGLSESRTQVVFSDGPRDASLMVVGEAPGANEDETGLPFVGAAGKYLDLLLATIDLSREDSVYIANVLKCRPPGNRNPTDIEIETCSPYLRKQIDLVAPRALLAVGSFSGKLLTGQDRASLGSLRGTVHAYHGVPLVVTYHPAALLRNPRWTRLFWDDLQLLRDVIDTA